MRKSNLKGIYPVLAAPFDDIGNLEYEDLKKIVEFQIKAGADGLTLFGFATEFYKLSFNEKIKMLDTVKKQTDNIMPIIATVNEQSTYLAIKRAKIFENHGADMLMLLPPFILPIDLENLINHYNLVSQAVKIPIILQYSPIETEVNLSADQLVNIMSNNINLKYIKVESKPPGGIISNIIDLEPNIGLLVGYAGLQMINALKRGAVGVMPGSSMTDVYVNIYNEFVNKNNVKEALNIHKDLVVFLNLIFQNIEMIIKLEKEILKRRGIISSNYCRYPSFKYDDKFKKIFDEYYLEIKKRFLV
jgi:4-hydroxy-tetrahydrodipicolinate synthase